VLPRRALATLACLLTALALGLGGCGDGSDSTAESGSGGAGSRPAPPRSDFPSASGKTLAQVIEAADGPSSLVVSPAALAFYEGENRYPFGVFERDGSQVDEAQVALYFAQVPLEPGRRTSASRTKEAAAEALEQPAIGPFPAAIESLATKPAFRAKTTTDDPDAASVVYVTDVDFPSEGEWRIVALVRGEDGELRSSLLPSASVGKFDKVPRPGEMAPLIHTPTPEDVGGDLEQLTTRIPPDTQHQVDYADALGGKPIVLLFATPQFCVSRVCGPVVDIAEQVKQTHGDGVEFIHMEIFNDNDPNKGPRPQVRAFSLKVEPWLFAIDRSGRIDAEIQGAFGVDELNRVVKGLSQE